MPDLLALHPQYKGEEVYLLFPDKRYRTGLRWEKSILTEVSKREIIVNNKWIFSLKKEIDI